MKTVTAADIDAMDRLTRVQFATSLPGIRPVALIGTCNGDGQTNLAPFSSIVHFGSAPLLLGMVSRPDTVGRHTLANIEATGCWTINHLHPAIVAAAHQCSARYPREVSEFAATGLTEHYEPGLRAPFVAESRLRCGLELVTRLDITANGTILVLGRVTLVQVAEDALAADGAIDLASLGVVASTAQDTYFTVQPLTRLPYAKPQSSS